jgi:integrase
VATIQERKTRAGKPHYRVQIRRKGRPTQSATFERKTDAKRWAQETEAVIREGRHFKIGEAHRHTLGAMVDRYLQTVVPHLKSAKDRRRHLLWWKEQLGTYVLAEVTPALISEVRDRLAAETTRRHTQRNPATVVRYLAALSHAFTIAVNEWQWVDSNPVIKVRKPREARGRVRFLSDEERSRLLEACRQSGNPHLYPVVVLAVATGMRQGEIMHLTWEDVDLKRGRITLHATKNNERRVVPLVGHALETLITHAKIRRLDTALVFPARQQGATRPINLRAPWLASLKRARIQDFRFHDLRHSAASYLAMNGASLAEIAEVLGHKTLQMVKRYAHLSEAHTAQVVASMNARIFQHPQ